MDLEEFLKTRSWTQADLAARYDPPISQGLVSQWMRGRTRMTLEYALQTEAITEGMVSPQDCAGMFDRPRVSP